MSRVLYAVFILVVGLCVGTPLYAQDPDTEAIVAVVTDIAEPEVIQQFDGPAGMRYVEVTRYPCTNVDEQEVAYEHLDLVDTATDEREQIAQQVIFCGGLGAYGFGVQRWSLSGTYLYYTDAREGVPDGLAVGWVPPVWRVDLTTMDVQRLGPARYAPNGQLIVAWDRSQLQIIPMDAEGVTDFLLRPTELELVDVLWLPDSSGVLYTQADMLFGPVTRSTVTHIDLEAGEQTILLERE